MSTDWRALCAELLDEVAARPLILDRELIDRARAALAAEADGPAVQSREPASVACEPSDGDLLQLMPEQFRADLGTVSRMAAHGAGPDIKPDLFRVSLNTGALEYARALLARWGRPSPAPAEGDVAESSVAPVPEPALARINGILNDSGRVLLTDVREALELAREALQQRQAAPVPVAWCNSGDFLAASAKRQSFNGWLEQHSDCDMALCIAQLPAHALPLPQGEVE